MAEPAILAAEGLSRYFGAVRAVDGVSLEFDAGGIHAVIGPNGAGKTTLLNLLAGELAPSAGRVRFRGRDITGRPRHRVARLGIGRSYQQTNVFEEFTCLDNCWLGAQAKLGTSMRFFRPARRYAGVARDAEAALESCRLQHRRDAPASALSHGERRQLELGMMLAADPELLLLDEPLAGMGAGESRLMLDLLKNLAESRTIVLVEHDMDAVFAAARRITVMVDGQVLETGKPDAIQRSAAVREAYLGEGGGAGRP